MILASESHPEYPRAVALVGPTAVGKTQLSLEVARALSAEIVSADSRQVYRYMNVGTDKVSTDQRAAIPHYMLDVVAPDDVYSAQRYAVEARRVLRRIWARGKLPLVVGGTGFFVQSLLDGRGFPEVPPNPELRHRLLADVDERGPEELHQRLTMLDPASAQRIHPRNVPRVVRALEIVDALGKVPERRHHEVIPALYLGMTADRGVLHARADERVRHQFNHGLVEETSTLLAMGYSPSLPSMDGFAYRQAVSYLEGLLSLEEAIRSYQVATRRYIRRQMTWFRRDSRIVWIESGPGALQDALTTIATAFARSTC